MRTITVKVKSTQKNYKRDAMEKADIFADEIVSTEYTTSIEHLSPADLQAGKKIYTVKMKVNI